MTSLSLPNPEIGIGTLVFGFMITFYAVTQPCSRASFIFFVTFFSLPPLVSLAGAVDGGGAERAVKDASGGGGCEGSRAGLGAGRPGAGRPGAGRPVVDDLPGVLSTKV